MTETQPTPEYNDHGQALCHGCGTYSDIIRPVTMQNANASWVSLLCNRCRYVGRPDCCAICVGDPVRKAPADKVSKAP